MAIIALEGVVLFLSQPPRLHEILQLVITAIFVLGYIGGFFRGLLIQPSFGCNTY